MEINNVAFLRETMQLVYYMAELIINHKTDFAFHKIRLRLRLSHMFRLKLPWLAKLLLIGTRNVIAVAQK